MYASSRSGGAAASLAPSAPPLIGIDADQVSIPIVAGGVLLGGLGAEDDGGQQVIHDDDKQEQAMMRQMGAAELRGLFHKSCAPMRASFQGPASLVDESDLAGWAQLRLQKLEREIAEAEAELLATDRTVQLSQHSPCSNLDVPHHSELDSSRNSHVLSSCFMPATFGTHRHDPELHSKIQDVHEGSEQDQAQAARYLVQRVQQADPSAVGHLSESGIVHAIVKWSKTGGTHMECRAVAEALRVVARHGGDRTKDLISDAGGVRSLMRLLQAGNEHTQEMVLIAMCDLVKDHKQNQSRFAEVGGTGEVMKALTKGRPALKKAACACLCGAVSGHMGNQCRFAERGCFPPLIRLAGAGTPGQQAEALAAICALAYLNLGNQAEVSQPENLQTILSLAENSTDSSLQASARDVLKILYDGLHNDPKLKPLPSLAPCLDEHAQGCPSDDSY